MSTPETVPEDALDAIADLLHRFSPPRAYAGDYHRDFARRIAAALLDLGWTPPEET